MRKRGMVILVGLVVLAAALAGAATLVRRGLEERQWNRWTAGLGAVARTREALIESFTAELRRNAETMARYPTAVYLLAPAQGGPLPFPAEQGAAEHLRQLMQEVLTIHGYRAAWVLDTAGAVRSATAPAALLPAEAQAVVERSADSAGTWMDIVHAGSVRLFAATPVRSGARRVGTLLIETDPARFIYRHLITEAIPTRTAETMLVRQDGDRLTLLSPLRKRGDQILVLPDTQRAAARAIATGRMIEALDYTNEPVWALSRPVRGTPWHLVSKVDRAETMAEVRTNYWLVLGALASLAAAIAGVAFGVWRMARAQHIAEVARQRQRFAAALDHAGVPILFLDERGVIRDVNARAVEFYGRARSELIGESKAILSAESGDEDVAARMAAIQAQSGALNQTQHVRADGTVVPVEVNTQVIREQDTVSFVAIVHDLSAHRESERRIAFLNRGLRMLSGIDSAITRETDPRVLVERACDVAVREAGFAAAAVVGFEYLLAARNITEGAHELLYAVAAGDVCDGQHPAIANGTARSCAAVAIPMGGVRWGTLVLFASEPEFFSTPVMQLLDQIAADIGFALDVMQERSVAEGDRAAAERRLRESEERYRAIVENSPDMVMRLDRELRCLYVNGISQRFYGAEPEQWIGRELRELGWQTSHIEDVQRLVTLVFATGVPQETEFGHPDDSGPTFFAWRAFPEYDARGQIRAVVTITQDVSARRRLEAQFQHAQKLEAIGRLAGGVAHDFNNILTAITGHAVLARAQLSDNESVREDIDEIVAAAERASSLTRQLLAFSRRDLVQRKRIDLGDTVASLERMVRRLIGEDTRLELTRPDVALPVLGDPGQIEQVVMNLVVNARDAMGPGGTIRITAARERVGPEHPAAVEPGDYAVLGVADSGPGIPADVLPHIFEPFFTTKEKGRGTGLGLSTVYGIVQRSGGDVRVVSEPGHGATFAVYLPLAPDPASEVAAATAAPAPQGRKFTVLVAEDERSVRALIERALTNRGHRVLVAANGEEALAVAARNGQRIDILLSDMVMPGMNGRELARRMAVLSPDTITVFMTGYAPDTELHDGVIEPGMHVVAKPFTPAELIRQLEEALAARGDRR